MLWAFGTCLIPLLLAAGVWRHLLRRVPRGFMTPGRELRPPTGHAVPLRHRCPPGPA
jgi:hypothetical protein